MIREIGVQARLGLAKFVRGDILFHALEDRNELLASSNITFDILQHSCCQRGHHMGADYCPSCKEHHQPETQGSPLLYFAIDPRLQLATLHDHHPACKNHPTDGTTHPAAG